MKTIEEHWQELSKGLDKVLEPDELRSAEKFFYCGAGAVLSNVAEILNSGMTPKQRSVAIKKLCDEMVSYTDEIGRQHQNWRERN